MSVFYLIIMWVWVIGATIWLLGWAENGGGFRLGMAGMYMFVALLNGMAAITYQAQGQ